MPIFVPVRTRLSTEAEALVSAWNVALQSVDDVALAEALINLGDVIAGRVKAASGSAPLTRRGAELVIDFPPFIELAMREGIAAIGSPGLLANRIARAQNAAAMLRGDAPSLWC